MSIPETIHFDKTGEAVPQIAWWRRFFLSLVILLTATLSFGLGRLTSNGAGEPVRIEYDPQLSNTSAAINSLTSSPVTSESSSSTVYASSKGKKYYYANCSGMSRISAANKITFPSARAAEASGLTLASNCQPN